MASVAHGQDNRGTAADNVAAGENHGDGTLHVVVDDDGTLAGNLKTFIF